MAAVIVDQVSKEFIIRHNRSMGIKTRFLSVFHQGKRERRERFLALDNISFTLEQGEALGLLGHNGSGKSTLLQLIAGILQPSKGEIRCNGRVAPLIQLGVGFHPELTGYENIFLNASLYGFRNAETRKTVDEIISFSELEKFIDTPIKHYSSGMQMRLGFAVAVALNPDILLADEILAVGDQAFQDKCSRKISELRQQGMSLILVSHNFQQIQTFCDHYLRLEQGQMVDSGRIPHDVIHANFNEHSEQYCNIFNR